MFKNLLFSLVFGIGVGSAYAQIAVAPLASNGRCAEFTIDPDGINCELDGPKIPTVEVSPENQVVVRGYNTGTLIVTLQWIINVQPAVMFVETKDGKVKKGQATFRNSELFPAVTLETELLAPNGEKLIGELITRYKGSVEALRGVKVPPTVQVTDKDGKVTTYTQIVRGKIGGRIAPMTGNNGLFAGPHR